MRIKTALVLGAGFGKRLNPLTLSTPKPLLKLNNITMLENCINLILKLNIKKVLINTFYLGDQILQYINKKKFPVEINVISDGKEILNTGGGILNLINHSKENDFIIFNPDTLWDEKYFNDIIKMQNFYFLNKLNNILLLTNKKLSFDKNLKGDFELNKNFLKRNTIKDHIYIGCQILNKELFINRKVINFPISEIWNDLLKENKLNGFESLNNFYHLTDLETFKKLKDL